MSSSCLLYFSRAPSWVMTMFISRASMKSKAVADHETKKKETRY